MTRIRFLRSYRGWATGEQMHQAGDEIEASEAIAAYLVDKMGRAERVERPAPEPKPKPRRRQRKR